MIAEKIEKDIKYRGEIIKPLLNRYVKCLEELWGAGLLSVAVFGSLARGDAVFPGSDSDLLLVIEMRERLSFGERLKLTAKAEEKLFQTEEYASFKEAFGSHPNIQEVILTPEELKVHPPILLDLTTEVIILHDTGILAEELEKIRWRLKELGAKKVQMGDSWFWILKPDLKLGEEVEL